MSKQEKTLTMTVLMTPDMANFSGNVHGGSLLKLLDQVAYACAAKYCKNYVVTAALDPPGVTPLIPAAKNCVCEVPIRVVVASLAEPALALI